MSESIKGSSSSLYIKEEVPNVTNSIDTMEHMSVQNLWGARGAADVLIHGLYRNTTLPVQIETGSVKRKIKITGHGANKGDFLKLDNGSADGEEVSIIKVIDADYFVIAKEVNAAIGDNCFILKPTTPKYAKDGSVVVSQGPVQYNLDSVATEVSMDTTVPANIKALPTELIFKKDGVNKRVSYDSATPTNSDAIPVNIVTVNGQGIKTTVDLAGAQINVQLSHNATTPDSVQIGNGTNLMAVNASLEAQVRDDDLITAVTNGSQKTRLTDGTNDVTVKQIGTQVTSTDYGVVNNAILHAWSTAGGGAFVDVKANTSGALTVEVNGNKSVGQAVPSDAVMIGVKDSSGNVSHLTLDANGSVNTRHLSQSNDSVKVYGHDTVASAVSTDAVMIGVKTNAGNVQHITLDANGNIPTSLPYDKSSGSTSANTLRVVLSDTHSAQTTPLSFIESNGTNFLSYFTLAASQLTMAAASKLKGVASVILGWDGANHRELKVNTSGQLEIDQIAPTANYAEATVTTTATAVLSAVAIKKIYIQAPDTNTANIRVKITNSGTAATTVSGWQFQAGRSDSFEMGGATCTVSVCSESGSNKVVIQYA